MEYSVKQIAEISRVSKRTLRYYDEINLLKPKYINSSGYRVYGTEEVDLLQQILFYRSLRFKLDEIKKIITDPNFDFEEALTFQYTQLIEQRKQISQLIETVEKTIEYRTGAITMKNEEKFIGFKQEIIEKNEQLYGKEIRKKYQTEDIEVSNKKWNDMTEEQFNEMKTIEQELFELLREVTETKDITSLKAKQAFEKHKQWLKLTGPKYSSEYHKYLGQL